MGTVIERISSTESGLHEAVKSLLTGFEVRLDNVPFGPLRMNKMRPM